MCCASAALPPFPKMISLLPFLKADDKAKEIGCNVFGITGSKGGKMKDIIEEKNLIRIDSDRTSFIQESTIAIGHIISKIVEDNI